VLALWAAILIARHLYRGARSRREDDPGRSAAPADMVRCAHCGLHVPKGEAVRDGPRSFCCDAHREAGTE